MPLPDYPFTPQRFNVRTGIAMSYLDEGPRDGEVVVMLHGNPSWSFYWRHLVLGLRDRYRCIVPDHVGMGLSDKPDDGGGTLPPTSPTNATGTYDYTLQSRIDDLDAAITAWAKLDGPVAEARLFPLARYMGDVYAGALLTERAAWERAARGTDRKALVARLYALRYLADVGPLRGIDAESDEAIERFDELVTGALAI